MKTCNATKALPEVLVTQEWLEDRIRRFNKDYAEEVADLEFRLARAEWPEVTCERPPREPFEEAGLTLADAPRGLSERKAMDYLNDAVRYDLAKIQEGIEGIVTRGQEVYVYGPLFGRGRFSVNDRYPIRTYRIPTSCR
jgi:hypothetical protein